MIRPIEQDCIHLSLEQVTVCAGHKVLMEVYSNFTIVADPQGILDLLDFLPVPHITYSYIN
jgi:hypothetical protein